MPPTPLEILADLPTMPKPSPAVARRRSALRKLTADTVASLSHQDRAIHEGVALDWLAELGELRREWRELYDRFQPRIGPLAARLARHGMSYSEMVNETKIRRSTLYELGGPVSPRRREGKAFDQALAELKAVGAIRERTEHLMKDAADTMVEVVTIAHNLLGTPKLKMTKAAQVPRSTLYAWLGEHRYTWTEQWRNRRGRADASSDQVGATSSASGDTGQRAKTSTNTASGTDS